MKTEIQWQLFARHGMSRRYDNVSNVAVELTKTIMQSVNPVLAVRKYYIALLVKV